LKIEYETMLRAGDFLVYTPICDILGVHYSQTIETNAMTTSSQCNTGRMCVTFPIITTENTSVSIHVAQKIPVIRLQKIEKSAV